MPPQKPQPPRTPSSLPKSAAATRPGAAAGDEPEAPGGNSFRAVRETIESIVVAFVLAFLFRTFEAEAFVIPTGSMSPSLLGQHKDANCTQCGHRFRVSASSEETDSVQHLRQMLKSGRVRVRGADGAPRWTPLDPLQRQRLEADVASQEIVGGVCPMCRYLVPFRKDLPAAARERVDLQSVREVRSYPGDRILVNKYGLSFADPQRWDVIVFKFPGNGNMNYIKRLVGLPGEMLRIYQGDLFSRPLADEQAAFEILRKPPAKAEAMLQLVHDNAYEPADLHQAGWPLRWAATTPQGWEEQTESVDGRVRQQFRIAPAANGDQPAWIRYRHLTPTSDDWEIVRRVVASGSFAAATRSEDISEQQWKASIRPELIRDFNSYNARLQRDYAERHGWQILPGSGPGAGSFGTEWVSDLAVEAEVEVEQAGGELLLDVVEAGFHFRTTIDLTDGGAVLSVVDGRTGETLDFRGEARTPVRRPGRYRFKMANVDDQLLLWIDGELVAWDRSAYDADALLGGRNRLAPWASDDPQGDQGDLAPAGVGARGGAGLRAVRLAVYRDIYYIATKYASRIADPEHDSEHSADYPLSSRDELSDLFAQPRLWDRFLERRARNFPVNEGQLFVLGDNSPESQDCRLWMMSGRDGGPNGGFAGQPGGAYLDRRLLIGKAVCVFWPHGWGGIPGLPQLPGWPNFRDMRLVR
jgi:signal peptidase I